MTERVLVVGGGIVGLLAAARHRDVGDAVTLVDTARVGGLLRSEEVAPGVWVDQGTHVPQEVGDIELDGWLFGGRSAGGWTTHERLRAGNVFAGAVDERTPFPDLNRLAPEARAALEAGLLAAPGDPSTARTALEALDATFGRPVAEAVFAPLLQRWYGTGPEALGPTAHLVGANRVVAFTPERTAELKASGPDRTLAWHDATLGPAPRPAHYPVVGGCGAWIEHLLADLDGVEVLEGTRVGLVAEGGRVVAAELPGGRRTVDRVVATVPVPVVLHALGTPPASGPPRLVRTTLVDLVVDRPLGSALHYATVLDPSLVAFRYTLYPNLRDRAADGPFALTAEVLGLGDGDLARPDELVARVHREAVALGLVAAGAGLVHAGIRAPAGGFPVPAPVPASGAPVLPELPVNVDAIGRGAGGAFFLADVLRDAHRRLPPPVPR